MSNRKCCHFRSYRYYCMSTFTCDRCLDVDHSLLLAQERSALIDDLKSSCLLNAAFMDKVLLKDVDAWLAGLCIEHLADRQLV